MVLYMVSESDPWSITLKSINKTFNRLRKYKFDRKTKRSVTMVEETERISRRVFGGAHPLTMMIEVELRAWRAALRTLETLPPGAW